MQRITLPETLLRKKPTLHSAAHLLADDLSREMREPARFGAYLGIARRYYESDLRALARRVCEKENLPADARGKYFFAALRGLPRTASAKIVRGLAPIRATRKKKKTRKKKSKRIIKKSHAKRTRGTTASHRQRAA